MTATPLPTVPAAPDPLVWRRRHIQWAAARPLWTGELSGDPQDVLAARRRPALLRFGSDTFMDDLAAQLRGDPGGLATHLARPLSFRPRPPGAPEDWTNVPLDGRLKLYLPLHGDFNLVAASLVCRLTGLPDHSVRPGNDERVAFVLRRLHPEHGELAWATGGGAPRWAPVGAGESVAAGEELFPMFPVTYADAVRGQPLIRRLHVGLVPVASRETFRRAAVDPSGLEPFPPRGPAGGTAEVDPRPNAFDVAVVDPLTRLRERPAQFRDAAREKEASAHLLLDFADLLGQHVPAVWDALTGTAAPPAAGSAARRLYEALLAPAAGSGPSWQRCLRDALDQWDAITGESAEPKRVTLDVNLRDSTAGVVLFDHTSDRRIDPPGAPLLCDLVAAALPPAPAPDPGAIPPDLDLPKLDPTGEAAYLIRCVYRRPRCAPFPTDVVSAPTQVFTIASAFDPDAPARPIRIPLPFDTSISDLRKSPKNVGFLLSNQLRGQMNRLTDLKRALNGELGDEEELDLGVLCQFSIPIITICALLVLIVFVFLLNIVFFWTPFFRICLPIPLRSRR